MVDVVSNFKEEEDYYAVAYKIALQAGNRIEIHSSKEGDSYLYLYRADGIGGYEFIDSDDDSYGNGDSYLEFTAVIAGNYYIVVTDFNSKVGGSYDLTVWNTNNEPGTSSYTQINYTPLSFSGSSASANGILNTKVKARAGDDNRYAVFNAAGYSFNAQANKTYKITVRYTQSELSSMEAGFFILKNNLQGYLENDIISSHDGSEYDATELTVTGFYEPSTGGNAKILLGYPNGNGLNYTVTVEEVPPSITLAQLLNNTTKIIPYSGNLVFTDRGTTVDLVNDPDFRDGDKYYLAVAYKIALQVGNHIEIHSSKEGDSYLYLYRADGTVIYENDDVLENSRDSYLGFTAETAGDYYIVVTDYRQDRGGRYYLTVWNTDSEPVNGFTP
jgi:hypothetical protein